MTKILLITDAWHPQINGVVTTLSNLVKEAKKNGDKIYVYHPGRCKLRFSLPFYTEIKIGIPSPWAVKKLLKSQSWDHIHIATPEGSLGFSFANMCRKLNIKFSTSCHTKFPEFINAKWPLIKTEWGWKWMRYIYRDSTRILTTTISMVDELRSYGFQQEIFPWTRGVDRSIFNPDNRTAMICSKPVLVCVSRISYEKNLDAFCSLVYNNATKIVVGDGPYLKELKSKYPDVIFVGKKSGKDLADYYRQADVFIFPSVSDTFGVVNIESIACGTPVAAFPVTGPIDIIEQGINGYLDNDLKVAIDKCLTLDRKQVHASSFKWSWENCYSQFKDILLDI